MQIYSRGFTGGMYGGRAGRDYITRDAARQSRRASSASSSGTSGGELVVERRARRSRSATVSASSRPQARAARPPASRSTTVRTLVARNGVIGRRSRRATRVADGMARASARRRRRCSSARARATPRSPPALAARKTRLDVRVFGSAGAPLKAVFTADGETRHGAQRDRRSRRRPSARSTQRSCASSSAGSARRRSCSARSTTRRSAPGLFLPVSELNHLRQQAVERAAAAARLGAIRRVRAERDARIDSACAIGASTRRSTPASATGRRTRSRAECLHASTTRAPPPTAARPRSCFDPFLRHPTPPVARVRALADELARARASRCVCARRRSCVPRSARRSEVARPRPADPQRPRRARRRAGARGPRRRRRLRGELLQPAHRGRAVPARRAAHHAVGRADGRRDARSSSRRGTATASTCSSTAGRRG